MIKFINNLLIQIVIWYLNYRWTSKFNDIKNKTTLLTTGTSLVGLLNHILNVYQTELNDKGLVGLFKLRRIILSQIDGLNMSKFWHRDRKLDELELQASLKHLYIFKDILSNMRYSIEMFMLIKSIIYFISSAAIIPFIVTTVYSLTKRVLMLFSIAFSVIFTGHYTIWWIRHTYRTEISADIEVLREYSIRFHNWLFNDHLNTAPCEPKPDFYSLIYAEKPPVKHRIWEYLPSAPEWIDWSLVGYTTGAIIIIGTSWAIYTGAVEPLPLVKRVWALTSAYFLGATDDGDDSFIKDGGGNTTNPNQLSQGRGTSDILTEDARTGTHQDEGRGPLRDRRRQSVPFVLRTPTVARGDESDDESSNSASSSSTVTPRVSPRVLVPDSDSLIRAQLDTNLTLVAEEWNRMPKDQQVIFAQRYPDKVSQLQSFLREFPSATQSSAYPSFSRGEREEINRFNVLDRQL